MLVAVVTFIAAVEGKKLLWTPQHCLNSPTESAKEITVMNFIKTHITDANRGHRNKLHQMWTMLEGSLLHIYSNIMANHCQKYDAEREQGSAMIFAFIQFILFYLQKKAHGHEFLKGL